MKFSYVAEREGGETYRGTAEAPDRFALYEIVRKEGGRIVSFEEAGGGKNLNMDVGYLWSKYFGRVKEYDRILFARNLGAMLSAGLPLARALAVMERQTKAFKLADVISQVEGEVRRGTSLHDAIAAQPKAFPSLFAAMVKAGEEGGDLPGSLAAVADQLERMYDLKKKIKGAMIYPCIILIAIVGIGFLMMTNVVPTLAQTFEESNAQLPASTQLVIDVSNFLVANTVLALVLIFGALLAAYLAMKTKPVRRAGEGILLRIPVIGGIIRELNAARTARTLSSLLSSGVDVITALGIAGEVVQNSYFRAVIAEASAGVSSGAPLSEAFARHEELYPAFVGEMMSVGEETGETKEMLKRLASYYEDEVDRKTKDMSTIVEPFLMLIIGSGVGFFAISMITPIYQLSQTIN